MNKKMTVFFLMFALTMLFSSCFYSDNHREDKIKKIIMSPNEKYYLTIVYKEPIMAFGSGHNELRLYSSYRFLGKCLFGEFSFDIKSWNLENNEIIIKINNYKSEDMYSYINQWTNKNTSIGRFKISYEYVNTIELNNE